MDKAIIKKVQSFGFDVYMRNEGDTWLIFTDGTRIGYLQDDRSSFSLSTVHKPNKNSGTGFQMLRHVGDFTKEDLEACFARAPHWALERDARPVVKYKDMAAYINENSFNREYKLIEKA